MPCWFHYGLSIAKSRHDMKTSSALLTPFDGIHRSSEDSPDKGRVMQIFDVFADVSLHKL